MRIHEQLLKEHNAATTKLVAAHASVSRENFAELMECFLSNEYRLAQRAAAAVSYVAERNAEMIKPYLQTLVEQLNRSDVHPAVIRNSLRVLQHQVIPPELHSTILNTCFNFLETAHSPIAFKAFSLTILNNLSNTYPEIRQELRLIIDDKWDNESPGFKARARKIIVDKKK